MNAEAFDAPETLPPAACAPVNEQAVTIAPVLVKGGEPVDVVILIEADQYSGA